KPRSEPMSGLAGGKVVKLDRVEWVWIPDPETQLNALVNGEIDMLESVNYDHLPILEKTKDVKVLTSRTSNQYTFRMNWLQPPFNDVRVRRAAAYALSQPEFLEANIGDKRFYRTCKALFTCGTPLESTVGMDGLIEGNVAKAKELLAEAKYEKAGFKVEVQPMDWQSMVSRLISNKGPVSQGGWSAFGTSWVQVDILDPLMTPNLAATCEKARAGWPCDAELEKLRDAFIAANTPADKKAAADAVQKRAMEIVTHIPLGEWTGVWAVRSNVETAAKPAAVTVFWGISKK